MAPEPNFLSQFNSWLPVYRLKLIYTPVPLLEYKGSVTPLEWFPYILARIAGKEKIIYETIILGPRYNDRESRHRYVKQELIVDLWENVLAENYARPFERQYDSNRVKTRAKQTLRENQPDGLPADLSIDVELLLPRQTKMFWKNYYAKRLSDKP